MKYKVQMTIYAIEQVKKNVSYISNELLSPKSANEWLDFLQKEIANLDTFPARYPCIDVEPWKSKGIRKMPVKNYMVYYWIDEDNSVVWITAIFYSKMDQIERLKEMPL